MKKILLVAVVLLVAGCESTAERTARAKKEMDATVQKIAEKVDKEKTDELAACWTEKFRTERELKELKEGRKLATFNRDECNDLRRVLETMIENRDDIPKEKWSKLRYNYGLIDGRCFIIDMVASETYEITPQTLAAALVLKPDGTPGVPATSVLRKKHVQ